MAKSGGRGKNTNTKTLTILKDTKAYAYYARKKVFFFFHDSVVSPSGFTGLLNTTDFHKNMQSSATDI